MDFETLDTCFMAALQKDMLIFTNLHTETPAHALERLFNMGAVSWLVAESVVLVQGQRRLRKLCPECCVEQDNPESALIDAGMRKEMAGSAKLFGPGGCDVCFKGYSGTVLVCETMPVTEDIKRMILERSTAREIRHAAIVSGMKTLRETALNRVCEGVTSLDEVLLKTPPDEAEWL